MMMSDSADFHSHSSVVALGRPVHFGVRPGGAAIFFPSSKLSGKSQSPDPGGCLPIIS
jgi:hypothetical protein